MGLYLWLSVNRFGAHSNEAFISLALPDWKNFLRLRIDEDGRPHRLPGGHRARAAQVEGDARRALRARVRPE